MTYEPKDELTEEDLTQIRANLLTLKEPDEDFFNTKEIVCTFYREGGCPTCRLCVQPDDQLEACKEEYEGKMPLNPMKVWEKTFAQPKKREKKKTLEKGGEDIDIGLQCSNCYLSENCASYEDGSECGVEWGTEIDFATATEQDVLQYLISLQASRLSRAKMIELTDGGVPDGLVSAEMDRLQGLVAALSESNMDKFSMKITATAESGKKGGGILSQLFGGGSDTSEPKSIENSKEERITVDLGEAIEHEEIEPVKIVKPSEEKEP
jgi:hypothetical protein